MLRLLANINIYEIIETHFSFFKTIIQSLMFSNTLGLERHAVT